MFNTLNNVKRVYYRQYDRDLILGNENQTPFTPLTAPSAAAFVSGKHCCGRPGRPRTPGGDQG